MVRRLVPDFLYEPGFLIKIPFINEIECASFDSSSKLMWRNIYCYLDEADLNDVDTNSITRSENKFDSSGNWTIKVTLEEKPGFGDQYLTVKEIEKRMFTYFP